MDQIYASGGKIREGFWDNVQMPNSVRAAYGSNLKNLAKHMNGVADAGGDARASLEDLNRIIIQNGEAAVQDTTLTQKLVGGLKSFGSTALNMAGNVALNYVISAGLEWIIGGISDWVNRDQIAIDNGKKSQQTISDTFNEFSKGKTTLNTLGQSFASTNQQITNTGDAIQSVATKYTELSKGVDKENNANIGLSDEDYQTYLDISSQLATLYPQLRSGTDAQGNAMLNLGTNAKNAAKSIQEVYSSSMLSANVKIGDELQQAFKGVSTQVDKYQKQVDEYDKKAAEYRDKQANSSGFKLDNAKFVEDRGITLDPKELGDEYSNYLDRIQDILNENNIDYSIDNHSGVFDLGITDPYVTEKQLQKVGEKISSFSNDLGEEFSRKASEMESKSASTTALIKDQWKGMTDSLGQYLQTTDSFDKLDSNLKTNLLKNLKNLDIESLSKEYDGDALQFMYDKFITPLSNLSKDQQQAISDVLNIDEAKSTASKYVSQVNGAFEKIFPNDKKLQEQWKKNFGLQDIIDDNNNQIETLSNKFKDAKSKITKLDLGTLTNGDRDIAYNLVIDDGEVFNTFDELQKRIAETKQSLSEKDLSLDAMKQVVTDTTANLSTLQSATSEASSATGLTADTITSIGGMFSDIDNFDSAALFKNTANGVKLNTKALSSLLAVQHDIKANDFTRAIEEQTKAIAEQNDVVQSQTKGTDAYKTEQDKLKSMFEDLSALQQAQSQYHALYKQQQELFSDYGQWEQAQSTANAGDKYNNMVSGLKAAKDAWDKGLVGTDDFKSFAKLISPSGATDDVNFAENYSKAARYLTEDESGVKAFLNDLSSKGLADFNEESQQWSYNVKDMAEAAKQMGMGKDFMSNMFGRLEDYGFHNNVISDAEDGVLKLSDAYSNLAESEARLEDLKKNDPTNTTAIEQAEKEVSGYKQDVDELGTNLKEVASHTAENYNRELETAKNQMKTLADERERILKSNEYGENTQAVADYMQSQIDQLGQSYGLDSSTLQQQAEQAAKAYSDALQNATIENPVTPDFGEDTASADAYASAVEKVQQANKDNNQTLSDSIKTLQQYNSEQIKGIDLFDGAYDSDELKPAEQALDNICQSLGLTSEEAGLLGQVLESMGIIKPEVDDSDVKQAKTDAEETKQTYDNLGDSTVSINADVSGEDSVKSFVDQCSSIQQGMTTTITATVSGESEVKSLESGLEQIPDNTPTTVDVTVNNQQDLDNIQSKVNSLNANGGKDITLNAHIKPDNNSEVEVKAKDTTVKVTPDPKEVEVTAKPVKVNVQPSRKEVSVSAKVTNKPNATSQGTINYKKGSVEKADGTTSRGIINYKKGDVEKADGTVSTGIINYNLGHVATPNGMVATGVINYTLGSVARPGKAMGTFGQARAYAQGSLTDFPAYASGRVSLPKDEKALVNEVGTESIVRDGQWSLIPGGAHLANLKKGDIIFSASQTEDLLKRGATPGHARAYAQGSLSDFSLSNAFGGGSGWGGFRGGLTGSKIGSSKKKSSSSSGGRGYSANGNSGGRGRNNSSTNSKLKHAEQVFDWVSRTLTKFKDTVENISNRINDYVSSAFKKTMLNRQEKAIVKEINANKHGARSYTNKANSIASGYTYYYTPEGSNSERKMNIVIPNSYKKAVRGGYWNIQDMDTTTDYKKGLAEAIQKYQDYYDKAKDCTQEVQNLYNEQLKVYEQWANMPTEDASKKIDALTNKIDGLKSAISSISTGKSGLASIARQIKIDSNVTKAEQSLNNAKKTQSKAQKNLISARKVRGNAVKTATQSTIKVDSTSSKLRSVVNKSKISSARKAKIRKAIKSRQTINTKGLKGATLKSAKQYNSAIRKNNKDKSKLSTAEYQVTRAQKHLSTANKNVKTQQTNLANIKKNFTATQKAILNSQKSKKTFVAQNALLDYQTSVSKKENSYRQSALKTAQKNMQAYKNNVANRDKSKKALLATKGKITTAQRNAIKKNQKVDTSKVKNPKIKKQLAKYNKYVAGSNSNKGRILSNALSTAQSNADQAQAEYAAMRVTNEQEKFKNVQNYYSGWNDRSSNYTEQHQKKYEKSEAHGNYTNSQKYDTQIKDLQKQRKYKQNEVTDLQKQLNASVKSGIIKKGSEEWLEMTNQILEAQNAVSDFDTQIEQVKQDKTTAVYEEMFDRAIEKANRLKDKISSINDLITEDMMIDKDTGNLTEMGALSITMNSQQLNTELNNLQTYVKKRQQIIDDFAKGSNKSKYGEKTYDELMSENDSAMQESLKNANSYRQSIISIVTNQAKAVQDAMFKEIDARKKALKKKKEYYDYDKTIKKKTDEIELIKQQIRGLEGLTDAESKAQKARLEASLKDKQDDLDDTVRDHVYDITVNGLDDLETQLSEDFEKWSNQLSSDLAKMSDAISNAISGAGENYSDMMAGINHILNNIGGISSGQYFTNQDKSNMRKPNSFDTGYDFGHLKGYARGTKHVGSNRIAMTNEKGREIIVTKDGWITPLEASDMVIPNNITETLIDMAERQQSYTANANFKMPELKIKDASGNSVNNVYNTFTVQGDLTRDTLPELNKILDLASSKTQNDIRKNKRRFG